MSWNIEKSPRGAKSFKSHEHATKVRSPDLWKPQGKTSLNVHELLLYKRDGER